MAIQDDWTVDYVAKTVTHTAGTTVYTVNALYSYLMDLFDELGQMDDSVPMSAQTPTEYSLINGWDFGAEATDIQFLSGGNLQHILAYQYSKQFSNEKFISEPAV